MSQGTESVVHENKQFSQINYAEKTLRNREFIKCEFISCDFSKSDLRNNDFVDCTFRQCNFSLAIIDGVGFKDVLFVGCKLMGLNFTLCNTFMFSFLFEECHLDYSTFFGMKLRKTTFNKCSVKEVDFTKADLSGAAFKDCDLSGATFSNTILEKTDFRTAQNFSIDPDGNKIKKARFSVTGLAGLLAKYSIDIDYNH